MLPVNGFLMRPRSRNAQQEGRRRAPKTDNKVDPAERPGLPSCSSLIFFRSDMRRSCVLGALYHRACPLGIHNFFFFFFPQVIVSFSLTPFLVHLFLWPFSATCGVKGHEKFGPRERKRGTKQKKSVQKYLALRKAKKKKKRKGFGGTRSKSVPRAPNIFFRNSLLVFNYMPIFHFSIIFFFFWWFVSLTSAHGAVANIGFAGFSFYLEFFFFLLIPTFCLGQVRLTQASMLSRRMR